MLPPNHRVPPGGSPRDGFAAHIDKRAVVGVTSAAAPAEGDRDHYGAGAARPHPRKQRSKGSARGTAARPGPLQPMPPNGAGSTGSGKPRSGGIVSPKAVPAHGAGMPAGSGAGEGEVAAEDWAQFQLPKPSATPPPWRALRDEYRRAQGMQVC